MRSIDSRHLIRTENGYERLYLDLHDDGAVTWRTVPLSPVAKVMEQWGEPHLIEETMD